MKIIDKIFRDKSSNNLIYIILAVGIVMLVCANSFGGGNGENTPQKEIASPDEKTQLERILSDIDGVGDVSVMLAPKAEADGETTQSVLVVAEGGSKNEVKEKIIRAVKAALGVDSHKIEVFERKEKQ